MNGEERSSPMLDQYRRIKREHQDDVLFFRLGDFYEMFAEDALEISALLNLTLTQRNGIPMCGIPYHAARSYIARLLKYGKKIAICEQLTEPQKGQKVIERQVVEIITPGTTIDEDYLDKGSSNDLASLAADSAFLSFAYIDLSTGDFYAAAFPAADAVDRLRQELERLQIREMLIQESLLEEDSRIARAVLDRNGLVLNRWADWLFDKARAKKRLQRQFGLSNLKGFGIDDDSPLLLSAGSLLDYLDDTAKSLLPHVRTITIYQDAEYVGIDEASQRNLELVRNLRDGDSRFSLLEVMDETRTAMGRRLLKRRILHPLRNMARIQARLDMVETLYRAQGDLSALRELLGHVPDLERLCSRLAMDRAHGKDMLSVKNALVLFAGINETIQKLRISFEAGSAALDGNGAAALTELRSLLEKGICEEPSILLTEGSLIREGYSAELDSLRRLHGQGRHLLEEYLEEERQATGIPSLKIRYNRIIGYFFEVSNGYLSRVPQYFIRRQGIAGGERFSTARLAGLESDINGASEKIVELEKKLFMEIREQAKKCLQELAAAARRIAALDAAQSLAKAAAIRGWVRPVLDDSNTLTVYEGRHPVVEAHLNRGEYIPNDIILNGPGDADGAVTDGVSFALITGPNMAGKSTYLRSAALITLMAQTGSFVPAREARIGICDRVYCRVGASDNLARGESTFLVEMNETAYILNTATKKSLVIMDEVGRGTGTNDGLSIAWAVSEELLNSIRCRTLFATHYHELSLISHPRMVNRSMEVLDQNGEIIFLRRLREGPAAESYGLHVARLAGLAETVLERAEHIMSRLRERDVNLRETLPSQSAETGFVNPEDVMVSTRNGFSVNQCDNAVNGDNNTDIDMGNTVQPVKNAVICGNNQGETGVVNRKNIDVNKKQELNNIAPNLAAVLREIYFADPNRLTPLDALGLISEWKSWVSGGSGDYARSLDFLSGFPGGQHPEGSVPSRGRNRRAGPEQGTPSLFD
ncbi:MAG: DNA mismatch repair protein MutS [Treponema sp.]|jgi:DNA mismatch repair protein MutS|nr:DNA mismatch repair protein MutS [Treponema sp.]